MKAPAAIFFFAFLTVSAAWQDSDGDYSEEDYAWNPPQTTARPVRPTTGRPVQSSNARPQSSSGRPQSSSGRPQSSSGRPQESSDDWCYPVADRVFSQLMRQANGNPMAALSTLEGRYSVRVAPNSSPNERLTVLVQTANSRLAASGYSSYRPVVAAVADKLAEEFASGGAVSVNLRPASAGTGFTATLTFGGQQQTSSSNSNSNNNNNNNVRPSNAASNWWGEGGSQGGGTQRGTQRPGGYRRPMSRGLEAPEQGLSEPAVTPGSQAA